MTENATASPFAHFTNDTGQQQQLEAACVAYGLNPSDIIGCRFSGGNLRYLEPPSVIVVTQGGVKLRHPMDLDTEKQLRMWLRVSNDRPLPKKLHLPVEGRTGIPRKRTESYFDEDR